MRKERGSGRLIFVLICLAISGTVIAWSTYGPNSNAAIQKRLDRHAGDLADPNVPPELSDRMRDPSWTIKYWMGVGGKQSDCDQANEMMDKRAYARQTTKRGVVQHIYYLSDYVSSCGNTVTRALSYVEPEAKKWCQYRKSDSRFETLCTEWEQNKDSYVAELHAATQPTVDRYASYPYKGGRE
jgi:hypothetical protein